MKHTEKYLQAKWVAENPIGAAMNGYNERDVVDAKRYCNAYLDGYNQALRTHDVVGRGERCAHTSADIRTLRCNCCNDCGEILDVLD